MSKYHSILKGQLLINPSDISLEIGAYLEQHFQSMYQFRLTKSDPYLFSEDEIGAALNNINGGKALSANGMKDTLFKLSELIEFVKSNESFELTLF